MTTVEHDAARALRESEQRYRVLVEQAPDGILVMDARGECTDANTSACAMLACRRDELVGSDICDFVVGETASSVRNRIQSLRQGETVRSERQLRRRDGGTVWAEITAQRMDDGRVQAILHDAGARRAAEDLIATRARQQSAVAEMGLLALREEGVQALAERAAALLSEGLDAPFAEVLQLDADRGEFALRAAAGWDRSLTGTVVSGVEAGTFGGCTLSQAEPLISADAALETRFSLPRPLLDGGAASSIGTIVRGKGTPWGIIGAHARSARAYTAEDAHFMRGMANVLAGAIARRHAYDDLDESRRFLSTLISNLPGYAYRAAPGIAGRLAFVSDGVESLTGYHAADFEASGTLTLEAIKHPDDRALVASEIADALRTKRAWEVSYRIRTQSGEQRWVREQGRGVAGDDGHVDAIEAFVTDITEQKHAEDEVRTSERRLRTIIEHAPEAIVIFDVEAGRFVDVNENATVLFGYARDELLRKDVADLSAPVQPDGQPSAVAADRWIRAAIAGQSPGFEWIHRNAAGADIPCEVRLVRLPSADQVLIRGSVTDIRERKRLEAQFLQAQKMESVGRLAGGIAHDFNNLMTAAIGYADLALMALPQSGPVTDDVREIRETAERAAALSHQLLAFSRRQIIEPRPLDLNQLVRGTERILRRLIGEDVELETRTAEDLGQVQADPHQLEQVLINLAVNARDAMPRGGRLLIETANADRAAGVIEGLDEAACLHGCVTLTVTDTGTGMGEDVRAHIFEPFYTTKEAGKGTGLGLATCYGVVKQAGGNIRVESEPGRGASFTIFLPRIDATARTPGAPDAASLPAGSETLLIVEDEDAVRKLAARVLRELGYTVLEARDGAAALDAAADHPGAIDLLLTDVVMPRMGGQELAAEIRQSRPALHVLFTSGYTEDAVMRDGVAEHAIDYLAKPFSPLTLARKVREILDRA